MKKLMVTIGPFETEVSFRVVQGESVLVEDVFHGKSAGPYVKEDLIDATDENIEVVYDSVNHPDLIIKAKLKPLY